MRVGRFNVHHLSFSEKVTCLGATLPRSPFCTQNFEEALIVGEVVEVEVLAIGSAGAGSDEFDAHSPPAVFQLEVVGGIDERNLAIDNESDAVAELVRGPHVVGGEKDGGAGSTSLLDDVLDPFGVYGVEPDGRFVEEQQLGLAQQRAGEVEAVSHSLREFSHPHVGMFAEPDALEKVER